MLTTVILSLLTAAPTEWTCFPDLYGDGQSCDCGCGLVDPDCGDQPVDRARCTNNFCAFGYVPMLGSPAVCVKNECGDGFVVKGEACDDGDGPGCSEDCTTVTPGYRCSGLGAGCSEPICGDRFVDRDRGERCDDGTEEGGDGCAACQPEPGYVCRFFGGCFATTCGDKIVDYDWDTQTGESCEDGNTDPDDGCSAYCQVEPGWVCNWEGCKQVVCGDGFVSRGDFGAGEQCDGGNDDPGDGCDEFCHIEPGWYCDDFAGCTQVICGDLVIAPGGENCDDGNDDSGDGCSEFCQSEPGWACRYQPGPCHQVVCGDGVREGDDFGNLWEECDDDNTDPDDGCSPECRIEPGWICDEGGACHQVVCGDGKVDGGGGGPGPKDPQRPAEPAGEGGEKKVIIGPPGPGTGGPETCDDGNITGQDGCDEHCQIEEGWVCEVPGEPCARPVCGDSHIVGIETCDDGNSEDNDGCSAECKREPDWVCFEPGKPCEPLPKAWLCPLLIYGTSDGCDCGCGAVDPDCPTPLDITACEYNHCLEETPWPDVADPTGCSATEPPVVEPEPQPEPVPEVVEEAAVVEPTPEPEPATELGPEPTAEPATEAAADTAVGGGKSDEGCSGGAGIGLLGLVGLAFRRRVQAPRHN